MQYDPYEKLQHKLAVLENRMGMNTRSGPIKEIKEGPNGEQSVRLVLGQQDGKEVLGPWTPVTQHRGEGTERKPLKKGQNMTLRGVNGDYRQAQATMGPESESAPAPSIAKKHGLGSWTKQAGKYNQVTYRKDESGGGSGGGGGDDPFHEMYLAEEEQKPPEWKGGIGKNIQSGGTGEASSGSAEQQSGQQSGGQQQEPKPKWKFTMHDKDGMAMINAKDKADLLVDDKHSRLKFDKNTFWSDKKGLWFYPSPPRLKKPPKEEHPRAEKA